MKDRILHMLTSAVVAVVVMASLRMAEQGLGWSCLLGLAVPSILGIIREIDKSREPWHCFGWDDIRDNVIGAAVGTAVGCFFWLM